MLQICGRLKENCWVLCVQFLPDKIVCLRLSTLILCLNFHCADMIRRSDLKKFNSMQFYFNTSDRITILVASSVKFFSIIILLIFILALGTKNDNFVRCPKSALDWKTRRFRMLEEIARHDADVICLQVWFALELMSIIGTFEA